MTDCAEARYFLSMLLLGLEDQAHGTLYDPGGIRYRFLHGSILSSEGASSKPGAVHYRPSRLICSKPKGERRATFSSRAGWPSWGHCHGDWNAAPMLMGVSSTTTQSAVPVHSPVQPVKVLPGWGVAVRVTTVPLVNRALQPLTL
jgi:hypothetical protein